MVWIVAQGIEDPSLGVGVVTMDIEDLLVGGWVVWIVTEGI